MSEVEAVDGVGGASTGASVSQDKSQNASPASGAQAGAQTSPAPRADNAGPGAQPKGAPDAADISRAAQTFFGQNAGNPDTVSSLTGTGGVQDQSPSSQAPAPNGKVGINIDPQVQGGAPTPEELSKLGIGAVRMVIPADSHNKNHVDYKSLVDAYNKAGVKVTLVLTQDSVDKPIPSGGVTDPNYMNQFTQKAASLASQFNNPNVSFEIFNEENHQNAKDAIYIPPEQYGKLLNNTYNAIRQVNGNSPVIMGGVLGDDTGYVDKVIQANQGKLPADYIGLHPYTPGNVPYVEQSINDFSRYGKPIDITEIGWEPDQKTQAKFIRDIYQVAAKHPEVASMMWYTWSDNSNPGFGVIDKSGHPKDSLSALADAAQNFQGGQNPQLDSNPGQDFFNPQGNVNPDLAIAGGNGNGGQVQDNRGAPAQGNPAGQANGMPGQAGNNGAVNGQLEQEVLAAVEEAFQEVMTGQKDGPGVQKTKQYYDMAQKNQLKVSSFLQGLLAMVMQLTGQLNGGANGNGKRPV